MKRTGNLFESIVARENFRRAVGKAVRGKRHQPDAGRFMARLDDNMKEQIDGPGATPSTQPCWTCRSWKRWLCRPARRC
jgi:hypothetical protein